MQFFLLSLLWFSLLSVPFLSQSTLLLIIFLIVIHLLSSLSTPVKMYHHFSFLERNEENASSTLPINVKNIFDSSSLSFALCAQDRGSCECECTVGQGNEEIGDTTSFTRSDESLDCDSNGSKLRGQYDLSKCTLSNELELIYILSLLLLDIWVHMHMRVTLFHQKSASSTLKKQEKKQISRPSYFFLPLFTECRLVYACGCGFDWR